MLNRIYDKAVTDKNEALKRLERLPIIILMLDGDTKRDFINLQAGRTVWMPPTC